MFDCDVELDVPFSGLTDEVTFKGNAMNITQRSDFGICGGAGFKIPLGITDLFAEIRYERGLTNARKSGDLTIKGIYMDEELTETVTLDKEENKYANQGLLLLLGFTFSL